MTRASRSPPKQPKADVGTYFLAKKSGLFRPGVALVLATALPSKPPMKTKKRVV